MSYRIWKFNKEEGYSLATPTIYDEFSWAMEFCEDWLLCNPENKFALRIEESDKNLN